MTEALRPPRRRDIAWALVVAGLLTAGALGVLWFNTALQRQGAERTEQQRVMSRLDTEVQALRLSLNQRSDPATLAADARRLHMHAAPHIRWQSARRSH